MQLIAQVALQVTKRMGVIVCRGADVGREIGNASRMSADRSQHLRPVFDIGELGKDICQPRLRIA